MGPVEILLWLVPAAVATVAAMLWVSWLGRERPALPDRSEAAQKAARERFAAAITRPHPHGAPVRARQRERSTGVAIRVDKSA
jgi:HAMP domain-containing protein